MLSIISYMDLFGIDSSFVGGWGLFWVFDIWYTESVCICMYMYVIEGLRSVWMRKFVLFCFVCRFACYDIVGLWIMNYEWWLLYDRSWCWCCLCLCLCLCLVLSWVLSYISYAMSDVWYVWYVVTDSYSVNVNIVNVIDDLVYDTTSYYLHSPIDYRL